MILGVHGYRSTSSNWFGAFLDITALQLRYELDDLNIFACEEKNDNLGIFGNFSLAYWDNDGLSALRAADCNIDDLIVGFTKLVGKIAYLRQHLLVSYGSDLFSKFVTRQMFGEIHFHFEFWFFLRKHFSMRLFYLYEYVCYCKCWVSYFHSWF